MYKNCVNTYICVYKKEGIEILKEVILKIFFEKNIFRILAYAFKILFFKYIKKIY